MFNYTGMGGGGFKTYRTLEGGGGTRPESCPSKSWTLDPQMAIFYGISVERGQFLWELPSDTMSKLLLTKNYSKIITFE